MRKFILHYKYLCELNIKLIEYLKLIFSIDTKIIKSSSLNVLKYKDENLNICEILNASNYISPKGSLNYLKDSQCFKKQYKILTMNLKFIKTSEIIHIRIYLQLMFYLILVKVVLIL